MSLFIHFFVRFSPETNYFVPVSILFILFNILYIFVIFRDFSKISISGFILNSSPRNS